MHADEDDYQPPRLVEARTALAGCALHLNDGGCHFVDISRADLAAALADEKQDLDALCRARSVEVFVRRARITEEDWARLSAFLRTAPALREILQEEEELAEWLGLSLGELQALPYVVQNSFGDLEAGPPALYLARPVQVSHRPVEESVRNQFGGTLKGSSGVAYRIEVHLGTSALQLKAHTGTPFFIYRGWANREKDKWM